MATLPGTTGRGMQTFAADWTKFDRPPLPSPPVEIALAMVTAPRKVSTVRESIASFRAAGFEGTLHAHAEPGSDISAHLLATDDVVVHPNAQRMGGFRNWQVALTRALRETKAPWVLVVEDDVIYRPDAAAHLREAIAASDPAKVGFLSPYASWWVARPGMEGWAQWQGDKFRGPLAMCVPRGFGDLLLRHPRLTRPDNLDIDLAVGDVAQSFGRAGLVRVPSLAEHVGATSTRGAVRRVVGQAAGFRATPWYASAPPAPPTPPAPPAPPA